jgi:hypothetical protein
VHVLAVPSSIPNDVADKEEVFKGPIRTAVLESPRAKKLAFNILRKTFAVQRRTCFDRQSRAIRIIEYGPTKSGRIKKNISYDNVGRRTVVVAHQASIKAITTYRYNDIQRQNEIIEKVTSKGQSVERRYKHRFNERGDQIYTSYEDDSGLQIEALYHYDYDKQGNISRVATTDKEGILCHVLTYNYDPQQRAVRKASYDRNGHLYCDSVMEYAADGFGEERSTYRNGTLQRRIHYTFDLHENLVEIAAYDALDTLLGRTTYTFLYDEIGNWVERRAESWDRNRNRCDYWMNYQRIKYW